VAYNRDIRTGHFVRSYFTTLYVLQSLFNTRYEEKIIKNGEREEIARKA